jgi:dienelactone hydrolase
MMIKSLHRNTLMIFLLLVTLGNVKAQFKKGDEVNFSFQSSVLYGSQTDDLSVHISTDYTGKADFGSLKAAQWKDITSSFDFGVSKEFKTSGIASLSKYIEKDKPLFIAFKYTGKASEKGSQRMWIIRNVLAKRGSEKLSISDMKFVNDLNNEANVGWEIFGEGLRYRSRMTKKSSESWAVIEIFADGKQVAAAPQSSNLVSQQEVIESMERLYLSKGPDLKKYGHPKMVVLQKVKVDTYERWHIKYLVDENEFAYAYILIPNDVIGKGKKLPAVMCPHPTSDIGKDRVVGIYSTPAKDEKDQISRENRMYAIDLVKRGFVVFAPDRAAFGQRRLANEKYKTEMPAFQKYLSSRHPGFSLIGKNVYDLKIGLNVLAGLDFVDAQNIGIIGHSLGAWDAIMLIAFEPRIKAAVVNSGGMIKYTPGLWNQNSNELRSYLQNPSKVELGKNANLFIMMAAPRSVLYQYSLADPYAKGKPDLLESFRDISKYYQTVSKEKKVDFNYYLHGEGHDFTKESRMLSYEWLEKKLKPKM